MSTPIAPGSAELKEFYRDRRTWRSRSEEGMRFQKAASLGRVEAGAAVLDIGARDGGLKRFLPGAVKYQGMDITPEFAGPDVIIQDVSQGIPFEADHFNYVFMLEVLEHVPNPFAVLAEIRRVLVPGGVLILSVPNPYHVKELIWNLFRIPDRQGHIYSWTRQTMTALGAMNGFRLDRTGGTYLHPPIPMVSLLARSIVYRFVRA